MNNIIERKQQWLFIGGDGTAFPVVEQGATFIGIPDRRFEWAAWDGKIDAETHETAEGLSGRDIAGIAQLTADADGRIAIDKANRPNGKSMCVVWAADGRARILQTLKVTEYGADDAQKRQAPLPRQVSTVDTSEREKTTADRKDDDERIMEKVQDALNRHAEEMRKANELTALALRHAQKMEDVARAATQKPVDTAMDIYRRMPMDDEARAVREAILNLGSIRKAAKSLGMNYNRARNVVQKKILLAYAKAEIPPERAFLMRPSVGYRRTPRRENDPINTERDLYQRGAEDMGENES